MLRTLVYLLLILPMLATAAPLAGQLERLELVRRNLAFGGAAFGEAGAYEAMVAVAHMRVDPLAPANRIIVDLDKAPREGGAVRYTVDLVLLRPRDAGKASRVLVVDVPNRGTRLGYERIDEGSTAFDSAADAGTAYLLRQGFTLAWIGWQGDIALSGDGQRAGARLPVATDGGRTITGTVRLEQVFDNLAPARAIDLPYAAASSAHGDAELTVRPHDQAAATPLAAWEFDGDRRIVFQHPTGFDAGAIFQFRYRARDPVVMGLGMAAIRDVTAYLRSGAADEAGQANPLADIKPELAIAVGFSQSGRFLRDLIWQGFNANPRGGKVFDGALPIVAGSRKSYVNARFAQPRRYSIAHGDHLTEGDQFPFTYGVTVDPVSGRRDGIFARCQLDETCPKLMHIDSGTEFWQGRASLVVTDGAGKDIALPENVRAYYAASTQHMGGLTPAVGNCQQTSNPAAQAPLLRAMVDRMVTWARDGVAPPPSRYPQRGNTTLVAPQRDEVGFPDLRALRVGFPSSVNELVQVDYTRQPPLADPARRYQLLVPMADVDGNDLGGVRLPDIAVPLATYTGWNLRRAAFAEGQLCGLSGMSVPLPLNAQAGDPRTPLSQRYANRAAYAKAVAVAARALRDQGYLLEEDVERYIERAKAERRLP